MIRFLESHNSFNLRGAGFVVDVSPVASAARASPVPKTEKTAEGTPSKSNRMSTELLKSKIPDFFAKVTRLLVFAPVA